MDLPEGLELDPAAFPDIQAQFNIRGWLQGAIEAKGGRITGGGVGCGG